ncbi:MAG: glycosyltransferase family 2 protein [Patescibacteria group bacterium]|jgi:hypothetical protein
MVDTIATSLSIVIVNYKTRGLLRQLLLSIRKFPPSVPYEVIVVDNHSMDGSIEMLQSDFPEIETLALKSNLGYSKGTNKGVERAKSSFVLLVNTDIVFDGKIIDGLVHYFTRHEEVGAVSPRLHNADGTLQHSAFRFYHFMTPLYRRSFLANTKKGKAEINRFLMLDWDHSSTRPVDWLMSSCLLIRKKAFDEIRGFDERFFVYLSDTDFCRRLWLKNWQVHYVADLVLVHYHRRESAERFQVSLIHAKDFAAYFLKWSGKPLPQYKMDRLS